MKPTGYVLSAQSMYYFVFFIFIEKNILTSAPIGLEFRIISEMKFARICKNHRYRQGYYHNFFGLYLIYYINSQVFISVRVCVCDTRLDLF